MEADVQSEIETGNPGNQAQEIPQIAESEISDYKDSTSSVETVVEKPRGSEVETCFSVGSIDVSDTLEELIDVPDTLEGSKDVQDTLEGLINVQDTLERLLNVQDTLEGLMKLNQGVVFKAKLKTGKSSRQILNY